MILLDGIKKPSDVLVAAERTRQVMKAPLVVGGSELSLGVSMGIATSETRYLEAHEILRDADTALYEAKSKGKGGIVVFGDEMRDRSVARLRLESDLHQAIERRQLWLAYQPIVSLTTGRIEGFEALARWTHPERGLIPPDEFIGIAEDNGLIVPMGAWILEEACKQAQAWHRMTLAPPPPTMAVNLAVRQLTSDGFVEFVMDVLRRTGLEPHFLTLEITENVWIDDPAAIKLILDQLRERDIKVHLDDFGTGYSSLSYLHDLPIDAIKLDRSFIREKSVDRTLAATVQALTMLGHNHGFKVIAEGVETVEQLVQLQAQDCDYAQGSRDNCRCSSTHWHSFFQIHAYGQTFADSLDG